TPCTPWSVRSQTSANPVWRGQIVSAPGMSAWPSAVTFDRHMAMSTFQTELDASVASVNDDNQPPQEGVLGRRHELIIEPGRAERHYWRDLWQYRELFQVLAWRDISVRYKQTVIGAAWALIRPFLTMVVFTIVFGKLAQLPSDGTAPYALMVFAGMLPWTFFAT